MTEADEPYLTRKQVVDVVRGKLGIPINLSTIEKAGMNGRFKPVARCGRQYLYREIDALAWAETLISRIETERV